MEGKSLIDRVTKAAVVVTLLIMIVVVSLQVVMRYVFHNSLDWAEEAARFLLVWLSFFGIVLGLRRKQHIGIDMFISWLPEKLRLIADIIAIIVSVVFWVILIAGGVQLWQSAGDQLSPAMQIKMSWVYIIIPICGVLLLVSSLEQLKKVFTK